MPGVLEGVRVLDFGRYIAGPWCAALLGDFGAEVIRVEKVEGGEDRFINRVSEEDGSGVTYLQVNRNKKCLTLDPTTEEGREVQRRLVATADVVVANMPQRALEQLGLDYASLAEVRPDVILVSNTCFGVAGPYGRKLGFDGLAQAMCGNMHLSGHPDEPIRSYAPWVDFSTAALCALGAVLALLARRQTGRGQEVQGALLGTALTAASPFLIEQAVLAPDREATGNRGQLNAPSDVFATRDGHVMVLVIGEPMYRRWAKLVGETHWLEDERFRTDDSRGEHGELFSARMSTWCAERTTEQALAELEDGAGSRRPGLHPAADPGRSARAGGRVHPGDRVSGRAGNRSSRHHPGASSRHPRDDPLARAPPRRAHGRDPGGARLLLRGRGAPAGGGGGLSGEERTAALPRRRSAPRRSGHPAGRAQDPAESARSRNSSRSCPQKGSPSSR